MEKNWLTQQVITLGLNGGWFLAYHNDLPGWFPTIYISKRSFDYHVANCIPNNFILECIYPWECTG